MQVKKVNSGKITLGPNFLVIGAQKCATTWLDNCLRQHESVFLPDYKHKKEVNFFDKYYDRGFNWYEKLFDKTESFEAKGEVSTHYISDPAVAERIHNYNSKIKLVLLVRNPIDRAFSHYKMILNRKGVSHKVLSFKDCYEKFPGVINGGLYHEHLSRFLEYFPAKQIKVILFDDIKNNPQEQLKILLKFLGVKNTDICMIDFNLNSEKKNVTEGLRFPRLNKLFVVTFKKLDELELYWISRRLKQLDRVVKQYNVKSLKLNMSKYDRKFLVDLYREDVTRLSDFLNISLTHWLES